MKHFTYLKNVSTLNLDQGACIGCGRCIEVCPHSVFRPSGKKVAVQSRDLCMECGACARNCPSAAVRVSAGVGCASGLITEWLSEIRFFRGTRSGGC